MEERHFAEITSGTVRALWRIDAGGGIADPADAVRSAFEAGFAGVEWALGDAASAAERAAAIGDALRGRPECARRACSTAAACGTTEVDRALEAAVRLLPSAASLGASCLNVGLPPVRGVGDSDGFGGYQDGLNFAHRLLGEVRFAAEAAGVAIALEAPAGGVLLSPVELREIVDAANSWAVGVCVDVEAIARIGSIADWLCTLKQRVRGVRVEVAKGGESARVAMRCLKGIGHCGPVIVSSSGRPGEVRKWLAAGGI